MKTARDIAKNVNNGSSATLELEETLVRIKEQNDELNVFLYVDEQGARAAAQRVDEIVARGENAGPLAGVPIALKDNLCTVDVPTTCASKILDGWRPPYSATVVEKILAAGAVPVGKTNLDEFAMGSSTENSAFGPTRNPLDPSRVPGGSSGGSAASVAAGLCVASLGTDTGGSIRGPAAWCGTVGIKPTYGRVSRRGVFPLSWTLDHSGPLTRNVEDAVITLQAIAGYDPKDPASADVAVPHYATDLHKGVSGLRIGIPRAFFAGIPIASPDALAAIDRTAAWLEERGATVEDVLLPDYALFPACGRVIMLAEAYTIHEPDIRARILDYGQITMQRFVLGAAITAADLMQAQRLRRELTDATIAVLHRCDALLTASTLTTAPRFDAVPDSIGTNSPIQSFPFNVTGLPAMSVPVGLATDGLPLSVQIVGRPFDESTVFRVGRAVEHASGWESVALPSL